MAKLEALELLAHELLQSSKISDYAPHGVQVRGQVEVNRLVSGVSASLALFKKAVQQGAEAILVHHGLLWDKESRIIQGNFQKRVRFLLEHDLTLMAFHLPLDCHPQWGNNALILDRLGVRRGEPFGMYRGMALSWYGYVDHPAAQLDLTVMLQKVQTVFGADPRVLPFGPRHIRKIAVCSGGAPELVQEAVLGGADLFLTGELSEPMYQFAQEEGIHVIAAGHYNTEKFGVQALGAELAKRLGMDHEFVDIPNPL